MGSEDVAYWLGDNIGRSLQARTTMLSQSGRVVASHDLDVAVVPLSEPRRGGQAATCRARVTIDGREWEGAFAVRAEVLGFGASDESRRRIAVQMAHLATTDKTAAKVLIGRWRTAQIAVPAPAVRSHREGHETVGLDIMEWAEPIDSAFVGLSGPARVERAVELAIPLFKGLDHIHQHQTVLHRDIDPSNVLFTGDRLTLIDWGIATAVTNGTSTYTAPIGKARGPYMAPETRAGSRIGAFTDAWALGVLLCEMSCGEPMVGSYEVRLPAAAREIPSWLREVIVGLTLVDRGERMPLQTAIARLTAAGAATPPPRSAERDAPDTRTAPPPPPTSPQDGNTRTETLADRRASAQSLLARAYDLGAAGQTQQSVQAYTDLIDTFDRNPDPILRQHVAMALNNVQWTQHRTSQHTKAVTTCSRLIDAFGADPDMALRQQTAMAFNGSGYSKRELGQIDRALSDWNQVVTRYGSEADLVLRQQVAMALRDKGLALAGLNRRVEAVGSYTQLIETFERDPDLLLRRQVAMALNNKRWSLYWLDQPAEAIATCTRLVDTFGSDNDPVVRQQVAVALRSKGLILNRSRRRPEALAAYGRLVDAFADDPDPIVQDSVAFARNQLRVG